MSLNTENFMMFYIVWISTKLIWVWELQFWGVLPKYKDQKSIVRTQIGEYRLVSLI
jgi:hypothetical protein